MMNPYEPSSDARGMAASNYNFYQAHIQAGFTEDQALSLLNVFMYSVIIANTKGE
jgi:hypothetical protein